MYAYFIENNLSLKRFHWRVRIIIDPITIRINHTQVDSKLKQELDGDDEMTKTKTKMTKLHLN